MSLLSLVSISYGLNPLQESGEKIYFCCLQTVRGVCYTKGRFGHSFGWILKQEVRDFEQEVRNFEQEVRNV